MNAVITQHLSAPTLRNRTLALDDPTAALTHVPRFVETVAGSGVDSTVDDVVLTTSTGATGYYEGHLSVTHGGTSPIGFASLDTGIATVDASGNLSRVANGLARINATLPSGIVLQETVNVSLQTPASVTVFKHWVTDSLGKHVSDAMLDLVDGVTASDATKRVFNTEDRNPTARNASCWADDINLTAAAFNQFQSGSAITNRHVVLASHFPLSVGSVLKFMALDNAVIERTVIGVARYQRDVGIVNTNTAALSNYDGQKDWQICTLNSALPASITPFKLFGGDISDLIPGLSYGLPILCLDQNDHATIREGYEFGGSSFNHRTPTNATLAAFSEAIIAGDSGDPVFLIIHGEAVLLGCHTSTINFNPYAANLSALYALIDAADDHAIALGSLVARTTLRPTLADLSDFTDFGA